MKKKLVAILISVFTINSIFAFDDNERISSLLNYVQLSTCKIIESENKGFIEEEYSSVLNNFEPSSLKNTEIIDGYSLLFSTLSELKINNNERKHLEEVAEQKRKNAIFNSLNSFGSVLFVPSRDPVSIAISLSYAAVNAGFNYARTVNDIELENGEKLFQISQTDVGKIDKQRGSLFTTAANVFKNRTDTSENIINEVEMKSFAKLMAMVDSAVSEESLRDISSKNIESLVRMEKNFKKFSPYWLTIGKMYLSLDQYENALNAFNKVYEVDNACNIFKNHKSPYIKEAAKQNILLCMKTNQPGIQKYLKMIEENTLLDQVSQDDNSYFFSTVYLYLSDFESAKKEIDFLFNRGIEPKYGDLTCQYNLQTLSRSDKQYKLSETMLKAHILLNNRFKKSQEIFSTTPEIKYEINEAKGSVAIKVSTPEEEIRFVDATGDTNVTAYTAAISNDFYFTEKKGIFKKKEFTKKTTLKISSISIKENGIFKMYTPDENTGLWKSEN